MLLIMMSTAMVVSYYLHVYVTDFCLLQTSQHMLGPKQFPLDRLLAIFYTIAGVQVQPSMSVFSQVR